MTVRIICGSNFGDEGKGLMTDYFASKSKNGIVIRFNGGAQAGHTVTRPARNDEGFTRHVFSHIGSGTFRRLPTYLAEEFIVNPILFQAEHQEMMSDYFRFEPKAPIFVHPSCKVTLPFDVFVNQVVEDFRGNERHGSVGVGIGETIERHEQGYKLFWKDIVELLQTHKLSKYIREIAFEYYRKRLIQLIGEFGLSKCENELWLEPGEVFNTALNRFIDACRYAVRYMKTAPLVILDQYDDLIFEGAQGLLLDPEYGDFPYVTRSSCGVENVVSILNELPPNEQHEDVQVTYVTRCYTTRHGAGPLLCEQDLPYNIVDLTNKPNPYQGSLRFAPFMVGGPKEIKHRCAVDFLKIFQLHDLKYPYIDEYNIAVTCLDQVTTDTLLVFDGNNVIERQLGWFLNRLRPNYVSTGPCAEDVNEWNGNG